MNTLPAKPFLEIFDELYTGPSELNTWVIDNKPGASILETISHLSSDQASLSLIEDGTTVAAHIEHLRWSLEFILAYLHGKQPDMDWKHSWTVRRVTQEEWNQLQERLKNAYKQTRQDIENTPDWENENLLKGVLAALPHAAYHLGAIKQLIIGLRL